MLDGQIVLYEVKPLSEVGKICHRAAEIIEKQGWAQRPNIIMAIAGKAPICIGLAIQLAGSRSIQAGVAIRGALGLAEFADWNDAPGRTAAEVIARLRSVK